MAKKDKLSFINGRRKLSELVPASWNPRQLTEKQAKDLRKSLEKFDLAEVPVVNLDGMIIAGHQRTKILFQLHGDMEIDVRLPSRLMTEAEVKEYNVRSNKNTGEWDFDLLANNFDLDELLDWGFTEDELKLDLESEIIEGNTDEDEVPEAPERPITVLGDVWLLGKHRLMCGDSTSIDAVEKLMDGKKADMVFTDPPYGMSYGGGRGKKNFEMIKGDDAEGEDLIALVRSALLNAALSSRANIAYYICFPWRTYAEFESAIVGIDLEVASCIVWNKKSIGLGNKHYRPQHEFIFYVKGGEWFGDKSQSDVWEMSRGATGEYVHPTQKPVELIEMALKNSSKHEDYIVDVFGGSGSTLIACERLGRINHSMELDPSYCDVIINRWQNFTGEEATHAETGKTYNEHKTGLPTNSI